jgi:hypothetical protein
MKRENEEGSCWNGELPDMAKLVLREMAQQNCLPPLIKEIVRWEVYAHCHLHDEEVDFLPLDGIVEEIKKHEFDKPTESNRHFQYSMETIRPSVREFMKKSCQQIANHRVEYSRDKVCMTILLWEDLLFFKTFFQE